MAEKTKYDPAFMDDEERQVIEALHRGEYRSAPDMVERRKTLARAVANTQKRKPVTMRLLEDDIAALKTMALKDGLPYQTLLSSIVHKFVTGRFSERD